MRSFTRIFTTLNGSMYFLAAFSMVAIGLLYLSGLKMGPFGIEHPLLLWSDGMFVAFVAACADPRYDRRLGTLLWSASIWTSMAMLTLPPIWLLLSIPLSVFGLWILGEAIWRLGVPLIGLEEPRAAIRSRPWWARIQIRRYVFPE